MIGILSIILIGVSLKVLSDALKIKKSNKKLDKSKEM